MLQDIPKPGAHHKRMTPKVGAKPTAEEKRFHAWIHERPCVKCGEYGVTLHHVTEGKNGEHLVPRRDHNRVVPLAARFHLIQDGPETSVHALGHDGFFALHGIDLEAEARALHQLYLAECSG